MEVEPMDITVSSDVGSLSTRDGLRRFDVALQKVELEMLVMENGNHDELECRSKGLKRRRDQTKFDELKKLEAQTQSVNELLAHEIQLIDEEFQASIDKTKEKLSLELSERIRVIELCRDGKDTQNRPTRSLRSKVKNDKEHDNEGDTSDVASTLSGMGGAVSSAPSNIVVPSVPQGNTRQRTRRATSPASIILDKQLDNDEIIADMYEINRDEQLYCSRMGLSLPSEGGVEPSSHRDSKRKTPLVRSFPEPGGSSKSEFVTVDLKIGEVKVGNDIYYKGECVGVSTSDSKKTQEVVGIIASVNNSEVHLKLSDGSKYRIYLSHLRNNRATLRRA